jgi:hypothetical protein
VVKSSPSICTIVFWQIPKLIVVLTIILTAGGPKESYFKAKISTGCHKQNVFFKLKISQKILDKSFLFWCLNKTDIIINAFYVNVSKTQILLSGSFGPEERAPSPSPAPRAVGGGGVLTLLSPIHGFGLGLQQCG